MQNVSFKKALVFPVVNESSGIYFHASHNPTRIDDIHLPFFDNGFLNEFKNEGIDYLLYPPFNHFEALGPGKIELPKLVAFDVKHFKANPIMHYINCDESKMVSDEE